MPVQTQSIAHHIPAPRPALLVHVRTKGQTDEELAWSAHEFEALAREVACRPVCSLALTRSFADDSDRVGSGTLALLQRTIGELAGPGAVHVLLVDAALSPRQQRELEQALELPILDRTQLILELFALRARTEEAKLTIELARARHRLPRLREDRSKQGREGGGGRGERGNTQIALAKERCRTQIGALERQLARVQAMARRQRGRREALRRVALVGYTNAGKSSWLSALTGTETLIADKPFASLGTTVRTLQRKSARQEPILLCDTVGFLRRLPHELIPSFQSTLDEVRGADLVLCVADATDPRLREQLEIVERTLESLECAGVPCWLLLNKQDRLSREARSQLAAAFPRALHVSAHVPADVALVRRLLAEQFEVPA
ncbi:MAG TPA: GTPase HflX [Polyangiales bacterium]